MVPELSRRLTSPIHDGGRDTSDKSVDEWMVLDGPGRTRPSYDTLFIRIIGSVSVTHPNLHVPDTRETPHRLKSSLSLTQDITLTRTSSTLIIDGK